MSCLGTKWSLHSEEEGFRWFRGNHFASSSLPIKSPFTPLISHFREFWDSEAFEVLCKVFFFLSSFRLLVYLGFLVKELCPEI